MDNLYNDGGKRFRNFTLNINYIFNVRREKQHSWKHIMQLLIGWKGSSGGVTELESGKTMVAWLSKAVFWLKCGWAMSTKMVGERRRGTGVEYLSILYYPT